MTRSFENPPVCLEFVSEAALVAIAASRSSLLSIATGFESSEVKMVAFQNMSLSGGAVSGGKWASSGWRSDKRSSIAQRVVRPAPRGSGMEQTASSTLDCTKGKC